MYIYNLVRYINLMKILMILAVPLILSMSIMLGLGSADMGASGQANQTSAQANQTSAQANQTSAQANQTSAQANQTSGPQMTDKLLSLANNAQRALNADNDTAVAESVGQIQSTLINASQAEGKQVVIVPSDVISPNAEDTPADTPLDDDAADEETAGDDAADE
jgi:hypothetical protein